MYCRHCGIPNTNSARFCSKCGQPLSAVARRGIRLDRLETRFSVPFLLILAAGCLPTLLSLLNLLYMDYKVYSLGETSYALSLPHRIDFWLLSDLFPTVVCSLIAVILALFRIIETQKLRYKDTLIVFLLVLLCNDTIGYGYGIRIDTATSSVLSLFTSIRSIVALPALWRWFLLILYLLATTRRISHMKKVLLATGLVLVTWSSLLYGFRHTIATRFDAPNYLIHYIEAFSQSYYLTLWINRFLQLYFALLVGMRIIKTGGCICCSLLRIVLAVLFIIYLAFGFDLGITGLPLGASLAYISIGIICLIIYRKVKKRAVA